MKVVPFNYFDCVFSVSFCEAMQLASVRVIKLSSYKMLI